MTLRHLDIAHTHLSTLLPAVQIAWADGTVQENERRAILALADQEGLTNDSEAMAQLLAWLEEPPREEEIRQTVYDLRRVLVGRHGEAEGITVEVVLAHARAVAEADGGFLGFGAIADEEAKTLDWLESELTKERESMVRPAPSRRHAPAVPPGRLQTLRMLLDEQRQAADWTFVDWIPTDVASMMPRISPRAGTRMPPAVFGIPDAEYREYMDTIVHRYMTQMTPGAWRALRVACHDDTPPLTDSHLEYLLWETPFSRLLVPELDGVDHARFGRRIARARALGQPMKLDNSHLAGQSGVTPGIQVSPTVALLVEVEGHLHLLAIAVGEHVFEPGDGEAWERARLFLTQGLSLSLVAGIHATLHFPGDSVVGVTREVLPTDHPVRQLIEGHAYLQLPLNYGVRWNPRSYASNNPGEIYTALPVSGDDVFSGFSDHYSGIEGNSAYPGYRYPMEAPSFPGPYGAALASYYDVVLDFCRAVVASLDEVDEDLVTWAALLHDLLPGFPSAREVQDPEVVARALAGFVHGSAIWHSLEHHIYSQIPVRYVPHRLRVKPPVGGEAPTTTAQRMRTTDVFRQELGRQMFYEAHTVRTIVDAEYGWERPELELATLRFHEALRRCEASLAPMYQGVDSVIACSIQF